jgi:hypothetical protein
MTTADPISLQPRTTDRIEASRLNGARSTGPVTAEVKARAALNGTRHGLCSPRFFLLPDEDPGAFALFVGDFLSLLRPRDAAERQAAERAAQARWREMRADRLEAEILGELFAAKDMAEEAEARAVRAAATRALGTLLRYRHRIQRDADRSLAELDALRQRPRPTAAASGASGGTSEPEDEAAPPAAPAPTPALLAPTPPADPAFEPRAIAGDRASTSEPGATRPLNRHQRRRLAALRRSAAA